MMVTHLTPIGKPSPFEEARDDFFGFLTRRIENPRGRHRLLCLIHHYRDELVWLRTEHPRREAALLKQRVLVEASSEAIEDVLRFFNLTLPQPDNVRFMLVADPLRSEEASTPLFAVRFTKTMPLSGTGQ